MKITFAPFNPISCFKSAFSFLLILIVAGCGTTKQEQLEDAAKDWCATIRASQVIPVYPLTEDIQPGDIFLVQLPVDKQQKLYNKRGYLPMDNLLDRMEPGNYDGFYSHSFLKGATNNDLPADWVRPGGSRTNSWSAAPSAAFPTYSFSVQRGAGINMAFPVEGVPVGLSLLGSDAADGTVIIKNAHTLGIDTVSMYNELKSWAATNNELLSYYGESPQPNYLRVVTRIYAVGSVDVSLRDAKSQSGGLDVGAAKPVNLLAPQLMQGTNADSATVQSNFVAGSSILQTLMTNALSAKDSAGNLLPGGSLRLTAASGRTISMNETFDPPLTIGYLGFDCQIQRAGQIGPPIPTFSVLDKKFSLADRLGGSAVASIYSDVILSSIYNVAAAQAIKDATAKQVQLQADALSDFIPYNSRRYSYDAATKTLLERDSLANGATNYSGFRRYMGERKTGLAALNQALDEKDLQYSVESGGTVGPPQKATADVRARLKMAHDYLNKPLPLEEQKAISDASSALVNYFIRNLNQ